MTTATEEIARFENRAARARYAADAHREARRRELAEMAGIVGRPRPRPVRRLPPGRPRSLGRWTLRPPRPGVAARFVWVPAQPSVTARASVTASVVTASAPARASAVRRTGPGWDGPGMTYDLSRTVSF